MNKIFLTQDGEVLRVQKRGQILLTLNAKENGNAAVAKRLEDVEDLRVTANIPNVSGIVRLPHAIEGSDMTIAAHYECNGTSFASATIIPFVANASYCQFAAKNTAGELKVWNPADLVQ